MAGVTSRWSTVKTKVGGCLRRWLLPVTLMSVSGSTLNCYKSDPSGRLAGNLYRKWRTMFAEALQLCYALLPSLPVPGGMRSRAFAHDICQRPSAQCRLSPRYKTLFLPISLIIFNIIRTYTRLCCKTQFLGKTRSDKPKVFGINRVSRRKS